MSRYHEGIYAPVNEELTAFDLKVEGAIPPELYGPDSFSGTETTSASGAGPGAVRVD